MGAAEIIGLITAFLGAVIALPKIFRWFRKPSIEREDEARGKVQDKVDHARKTGRPKW